MFFQKKLSQRRLQLRESMNAGRLSLAARVFSSSALVSSLMLVLFAAAATAILWVDVQTWVSGNRPPADLFSLAALVALVCLGAAVYTVYYGNEVVQSISASASLLGLLLLLLVIARLVNIAEHGPYFATGVAVTCAIILTIVHNQRFAIGISLFFAVLVCMAAGAEAGIQLYLTMMAGVLGCCFALTEIRTRTKLLEVTASACFAVLVTALAAGFIFDKERGSPSAVVPYETLRTVSIEAIIAAATTLGVGVLLQGLLPVIERVFRVATSMTLLDYSDANQPLLRRLAIEAPGTFSHSLLVGALAEAAAESIGANGLLARVGAYYHDIGKINKPAYFIENQLGLASRHEQLSPMMSQLVIVGHVKDGIEMAKEYRLPRILWQFIESHHGTTLVEYFYNKAQKLEDEGSTVSESEFRYGGPLPATRETAIVMLCDAAEGAVRSLSEITPMKIEAVIHAVAMRRLQDGQFDRCDMTFRELSAVEESITKSLIAQYHGRIAYPAAPDESPDRSGSRKAGEETLPDPDAYEADD
jgi:hypothetical protein